MTELRGNDGVYVLLGDRSSKLATSGTFSPTLNQSIALVRLPLATQIGDTVHIVIRDKMLNAKVVKYPFARNCNSLISQASLIII